MIKSDNDKIFFDTNSEKIKSIIHDFFLVSEEEKENRIKEIKTFYGFLLNSKVEIEERNKLGVFYINTCRQYLADWAIDFMTTTTVSLFKKEINEKLLINNEYFAYRFLGNKEKIKNIFNRVNALFEINYLVSQKHVINFSKTEEEKNKQFAFYKTAIDSHYQEIVKMFKIKTNINSYINLLKEIFEKDYLLQYITDNDAFFFVLNQDKKIVFSDFFKSFFAVFFYIQIIDETVTFNSNDYQKIKNEFVKKIKINFI